MAQNSYANGYHSSHSASSSLPTASEDLNGNASEDANLELEGSSTVDHALLESLFYNEMMMLSPSSPGSSNFLSQHFNEATHSKPHQSSAPIDPNALAEKEMLRDFGVSSSPIRHTAYRPSPPPPMQPPSHSQEAAAAPMTHSWAPPPAQQPQHAHIAPAIPIQPAEAPRHVPIYPAPTHHMAPRTVYTPVAVRPAPVSQARPLSIDTNLIASQTGPGGDRTKQLVDQFATLASRLGIELPNNVLQSLTAAAAKNDPQFSATGGASSTKAEAIKSNGALSDSSQQLESSVPPLAEDPTANESGPATLLEIRKTAEEAIASVTKKRVLPEAEDNASTSKHAKRKKKPRLSDCETRLAELRAENELLKRHLENVSNKAQRFDQEKEAAGKRIHALLEQNAGPEEMNRAVGEFTEMYSDYGKNRQQELNFHLEQLQRLVNPTNFTKMGLWTLGQNSVSPKHNPIAGILQKELEITPQQGKKILDQSEKIKALCDNLKECLALLAKLKSLCQQKTQIFQDRMDKCREILTTKQVVKLIKWIDDHTELLEVVCPGWGTEHIHTSAPKQPPASK
eukprot:CAMPEP_0176022424 /NCGR_PEP_ID=MMETSP0120_2-20121206/10915_1 /TAXON_ID=160619 /ORGANISM="Kryptoperidinium foliaceum, Strain CCMP 1326" /LENGTH=567 /DNA_ID=CAMNT_0017355563 /DNA_START=85 /DNA_END=1788 /DNA_ORIENTATION=+